MSLPPLEEHDDADRYFKKKLFINMNDDYDYEIHFLV